MSNYERDYEIENSEREFDNIPGLDDQEQDYVEENSIEIHEE